MKTIGFLFAVLVSALLFVDQSNGQEKTKDGDVYFKADEMPVFPGGENAFISYISNNVKYPEEAKKEGISGKVFVSFIVSEAGKVADVKIEKGVCPSLDKESVRVVEGMPEWKPGKQDGKNVKVQLTIPIQYSLN